MKKIITLFLAISLFAIESVIAQAPEAFKYQAIARNSAGSILASQNVSFRISILQGSTSGTSVYSETQTATTNQFGLANLNIGQGTVVSGTFSSINWGANTNFVKIEFDAAGGSNYILMGTSQLLSVPYSLYSASTGDTTTWQKNINNLFYNKGSVSVNYGIIPDTKNIFTLNGTWPTVQTARQIGVSLNVTSAGNASFEQDAMNIIVGPGYTGPNRVGGLAVNNNAAGTGTNEFGSECNIGAVTNSGAPTTGVNIGLTGFAQEGLRNYGVFGIATTDAASKTNIGVAGFSQNGGTSGMSIGGYFGLQKTLPTYTSCALMADNGATAAPIFIARANGIEKFLIDNTGKVGIGTSTLGGYQLTLNGGMEINGSATPGFILTPNAGATKTGSIFQSSNQLIFGASGVANIGSIDLTAPGSSFSFGSDGSFTENHTLSITSGSPLQIYTADNSAWATFQMQPNGHFINENYTINVTNGDVYVSNNTKGIILVSPSGQCYRVTVGNTGVLTSAAIACPN